MQLKQNPIMAKKLIFYWKSIFVFTRNVNFIYGLCFIFKVNILDIK